MTLEEHVLFRVLALELPNRQVLYVTLEEHISFRASALGHPERGILCDPQRHIVSRALVLRLPHMEALVRDS